MKITVIIPTYKRPQDLARCLEGFQKQTRIPEEILVIVRDSDVETWTFLKNSEFTSSLPLQIVEVKDPGQVAALNKGLDLARGDIIAIIDDDAVPHEDWLQRIESYYLADETVDGVGGRDRIYVNGELRTGATKVVGRVKWFGKVIGSHHIGIGEPREVDWLRGSNMSFRRATVGEHRFDDSLRGKGVEGSNDLVFCLGLKLKGCKLIYDPEIEVDHYPGQTFYDFRRDGFSPEVNTNSVYNVTYTLLNYLSPLRRIVYIFWAVLVGTRGKFGIVQFLRFLPSQRQLAWQKLIASIRGHWRAWRSWKGYLNDKSVV